MNKEQQYRTGRMAEIDPIPEWVHERVAKIVDKRSRAFDVTGTARKLMRELTTERGRLLTARALLGITSETPVDGLLARTQALVNADPTREAEYWDAMWIVRQPAQVEAEYRRLLKPLARVLETRQRYREAGWPDAWHHKICELWLELEGTPASARAWARAGWSPEDALTQRVLVNGRNASLEARVALMHPPVYEAPPSMLCAAHRHARALVSSEGGHR